VIALDMKGGGLINGGGRGRRLVALPAISVSRLNNRK